MDSTSYHYGYSPPAKWQKAVPALFLFLIYRSRTLSVTTMNTLTSTSICRCRTMISPSTFSIPRKSSLSTHINTRRIKIFANSNEVDTQVVEEKSKEELESNGVSKTSTPSTGPAIDKDIKKVISLCYFRRISSVSYVFLFTEREPLVLRVVSLDVRCKLKWENKK